MHSCFLFIFGPYRTKARSAASIILRGANDFMVDEMERSMHDALCVVKRVLESKMVVPGGGAVEAALSIYLENFATSLVSANSVFPEGPIHTKRKRERKQKNDQRTSKEVQKNR